VVQNFAGCPYRHLLERGFRLEPWKEPERVFQLDSLAYGSLYHEVAHRLFAWLQKEGLLPIPPGRLSAIEEELRKIVDEAAQELVTRGEILNAALLAPAIGSIHSAFSELLQREAKEEDEFVPAQFEQPFEGVEVPLGDGRAISFNGWIDRVDVAAGKGKRLRVVDYKTGKFRWKEGEQFHGGRELQLAIYNRAAAKLFERVSVSEARYYFATPAGKYKTKACPASPEVDGTLVRVLRVLDDTARAGVFAPVADTCDYCDVKAACQGDRTRRAERKKGDPRLAAFLELRTIP
jgi:ATP-dependent helicase/DNAse subunit B